MTGSSELDELLSNATFLRGLDERHVARLRSIASVRDVPPNTFLFKLNEPADRCFLICEGHVALEVYDSGQGPRPLETLGPGSVLGWSWLIEPHTWSFDARALEPTKVVALEAEGLRGAMEADHELGYRMLRRFLTVFTERLRDTRLQLLDLYAPSGRAHP